MPNCGRIFSRGAQPTPRERRARIIDTELIPGRARGEREGHGREEKKIIRIERDVGVSTEFVRRSASSYSIA